MLKLKLTIGLIFIIVGGFAVAEEAPPQPKRKDAPAYPSVCMQSDRQTDSPESVTVVYTINRSGLTEQIRVRESTDDCFDDAAITAVRGWVFEPKLINRRIVALEDQEVTFTFVLNEPTFARDFDARPIIRVPPRYPAGCERRAKSLEAVTLQFDVNERGETENVAVVETTNSCFNRAAQGSVKGWKYRPKIIDGEPAVRKNVVTQIRFQLAGAGPPSPEERVRPPLRRKLLSAQRKLNRDHDIDDLLADLAAIEAEYADSFSPVELQAFHQLRAQARIKAADYRGALDDFRVVKRFPMSPELTEGVEKMIAALEHELSRSASEEAPSKSDGAPHGATPPEEEPPAE